MKILKEMFKWYRKFSEWVSVGPAQTSEKSKLKFKQGLKVTTKPLMKKRKVKAYLVGFFKVRSAFAN